MRALACARLLQTPQEGVCVDLWRERVEGVCVIVCVDVDRMETLAHPKASFKIDILLILIIIYSIVTFAHSTACIPVCELCKIQKLGILYNVSFVCSFFTLPTANCTQSTPHILFSLHTIHAPYSPGY